MPSVIMIARQVVYSGRVQGVGFRYSVKRLASGFDVLGTVRNLDDGSVELKAMSDDPDELSGFLEAILESDLGSLIKEHHVTRIPAMTGVRGFLIEA